MIDHDVQRGGRHCDNCYRFGSVMIPEQGEKRTRGEQKGDKAEQKGFKSEHGKIWGMIPERGNGLW